MNILITVNTYFPFKDGVQAVTQNHVENLIKLGKKVTVITKHNENLPERERINGAEVIRIKVVTKGTIHHGEKKKFQNLLKELSQENDILINVCTQTGLTDWSFHILKELQMKKILYLHGMYESNFEFSDVVNFKLLSSKAFNWTRWKLYYFNNLETFKEYDGIINLHDYENANVYFRNKKFSNLYVIENPVEDRFFEFNKKKQMENYLLNVSNYLDNKNQEYSLEAFYRSSAKNYTMVYIGGEKTKYLIKLQEKKEEFDLKYGTRKVEFLVGVPREIVCKYIKNASICLFSSKAEKYSVAISESMASKVPFISTNVGCVRLMPGGIVVNTKDEMAYWINLLIKNKFLKKKMGELGFHYAQDNNNSEKLTKKLENILLKVMKGV